MNKKSRTVPRFVTVAVASGIGLLAAGCGSSDDPAPAPPAAPPAPADTTITRSGSVQVIGAVKNAVVCLDLDGDGACGASEPVSAKTGEDGAYTVTYTRAAVSAEKEAASSLIAAMAAGTAVSDATAIDMNDPTSPLTARAYALKQVPGKDRQINPLTTMVAAGMAGGMTEAVARTNASKQLGIAEAKIDDYRADAAPTATGFAENAKLWAGVVAAVLEDGLALDVQDQDQAVAAAQWDLVNLRYTDAQNLSYREFSLQAKAAGTPGTQLVERRLTRTSGTNAAGPYVLAYLTPSGWRRCDDTVPLRTTAGRPTRSVFCDVLAQGGWRDSVSIAGRSMAEVVTQLQADRLNFINVGASNGALATALGGATFPAGSTLRPGTFVNLNQPWYISNVSTDVWGGTSTTTLEQFVSERQAQPGPVANPPAASISLGAGSANGTNMRASFVGAPTGNGGNVQYYECDLDATLTVFSNCRATRTGTYVIETVDGSRMIRFPGAPANVGVEENAYAEVKVANQVVQFTSPGDRIYRVRRTKPDLDSNVIESSRLNGVGWTAMKTQLGL